jgi:REP element-mobilizing transposase RayT
MSRRKARLIPCRDIATSCVCCQRNITQYLGSATGSTSATCTALRVPGGEFASGGLMSRRKENARSESSPSLPHARWHCQEHVVCVPQRRRQPLLGHMRPALGPLVQARARQKACRSIAGHGRPDPVPRCIERPPKPAVASGSGSLTGQSAMAMARQLGGRTATVWASTAGHAGTRCRPWVLSWSQAVPISATKKRQTDQDDLRPCTGTDRL